MGIICTRCRVSTPTLPNRTATPERPNKRTKAGTDALVASQRFFPPPDLLVYLASFYYEFHILIRIGKEECFADTWLTFAFCFMCLLAFLLGHYWTQAMIFQCVDPKGTDWRWPQKSNCHYCPFCPCDSLKNCRQLKIENFANSRLKMDVLVIRCGEINVVDNNNSSIGIIYMYRHAMWQTQWKMCAWVRVSASIRGRSAIEVRIYLTAAIPWLTINWFLNGSNELTNDSVSLISIWLEFSMSYPLHAHTMHAPFIVHICESRALDMPQNCKQTVTTYPYTS